MSLSIKNQFLIFKITLHFHSWATSSLFLDNLELLFFHKIMVAEKTNFSLNA